MITSLYAKNQEKLIIERYHKYCDDLNYRKVENFKHKLDDYRKERDNQYYDNYDEIVEDLGQSGRKRIIKTTLAPFILLIIVASFTFIVLILYILSCIGILKCQQNKICFIIAVILLICLLACYIVGIIYAVKSSKKRNEAYCYLYKMQTNAVIGNNQDKDEAFAGFRTLVKVQDQFINDVPKMVENKNLYAQVKANCFEQRFSNSYNSLDNFEQNNKTIQTYNSSGIKKIPISNSNLEIKIIDQKIKPEFDNVNQISKNLDSLAQTGLSIAANEQYRQGLLQIIQKLKLQLQNIENLLVKIFFTDGYFDKIDDHILKGGRTTFYSTIPLILLFIIALILSCFKKTKKIAYIVMIVACLVFIALVIGFIFWNFGVAEISGLCGIAREVNTGNYKIIEEIGGDETITSFTQSCILESGKNDFIDKKIKANSQQAYQLYNQQVDYLTTLTLYEKFLKKNQNKSITIEQQQQNWNQIVNGNEYDHLNVDKDLQEFNDQIECSSQSYTLSQNSTNNNEISFQKTNQYKAPSCIINQLERKQNEQLFNNLKLYSIDAQNNAQRLINDIGKINEQDQIKFQNELQKQFLQLQNIPYDFQNQCKAQAQQQFIKNNSQGKTPHELYAQHLFFLRSTQDQIKSIQNLHPEFLKLYENRNDYRQSLNCRMFYKDALRLEYQACYQFAYHNYNAIIVWSCIIILAFLFLLTMFWVMSQKKQKINKVDCIYEPVHVIDRQTPAYIYKDKKVPQQQQNYVQSIQQRSIYNQPNLSRSIQNNQAPLQNSIQNSFNRNNFNSSIDRNFTKNYRI